MAETGSIRQKLPISTAIQVDCRVLRASKTRRFSKFEKRGLVRKRVPRDITGAGVLPNSRSASFRGTGNDRSDRPGRVLSVPLTKTIRGPRVTRTFLLRGIRTLSVRSCAIYLARASFSRAPLHDVWRRPDPPKPPFSPSGIPARSPYRASVGPSGPPNTGSERAPRPPP